MSSDASEHTHMRAASPKAEGGEAAAPAGVPATSALPPAVSAALPQPLVAAGGSMAMVAASGTATSAMPAPLLALAHKPPLGPHQPVMATSLLQVAMPPGTIMPPGTMPRPLLIQGPLTPLQQAALAAAFAQHKQQQAAAQAQGQQPGQAPGVPTPQFLPFPVLRFPVAPVPPGSAVPARPMGSAALPPLPSAAAGGAADEARPSTSRRSVVLKGPCGWCGTQMSSQWRSGPPDRPTLCNACGLHWRKTRSLPQHTCQVAQQLEGPCECGGRRAGEVAVHACMQVHCGCLPGAPMPLAAMPLLLQAAQAAVFFLIFKHAADPRPYPPCRRPLRH